MALGFKAISELSHLQGYDGIPMKSIPGDSGGVVTDIVIIASGDDLTPNDPTISCSVYPSEDGESETGTDINGSISATVTLLNSGDDINWFVSGGGSIELTAGLWDSVARSVINSLNGSRGLSLQFLSLVVGDFDPDLNDPPENLDATDEAWDEEEEKGTVELSFTYDNPTAENPIGFAILRDGVIVGSLPWVNGTTSYSYIDYVFAVGSYTYTIQAYRYSPSNQISPASNSVVATFSSSGLPDISVTGDINIDIDWSSSIVFIADPSGIYTLVPGKTDDTLYTHTTPDTVDVKIPDPFIKTAFIGE